MRTVYPIGTTLYKPSQCDNGYTLLFRQLQVSLIDMNGQTRVPFPSTNRYETSGKYSSRERLGK